jgi:prepilin-type N-terminal cleavage/methylation domain-containing protein
MEAIKRKWPFMSVRRKGFSLLEILLCLAILGFILLALGEMEDGIRRTNARFASALKEKQPADLLLHLASDIHKAREVTVLQETLLQLRMPEDEVITWTLQGQNLTREFRGRTHRWRCAERPRFQTPGDRGEVRILLPVTGCVCTLRVGGGIP